MVSKHHVDGTGSVGFLSPSLPHLRGRAFHYGDGSGSGGETIHVEAVRSDFMLA